MSERSLFIVKAGNGVTVAIGFVTGEATPAWTTQRAPYNSWVTCRFSTWTPPWAPVEDSARLFSTLNQSPSAGERALYFQVRREMMRFPSLELFRGSNHSPLICNLVSNRYGGQSRFFSQNVVCTFALHRSNGKGGMVATVLVTGEATPAWTTQRVPYNYWVTCRYSTSTTSWTPVAHRGGVFSTQQCTI